MDKDKIVICIFMVVIIVIVGTFFSILLLSIVPAEDNLVIDGDDVAFYNIINADELEIIIDDGTVYTVRLGYGDDVVDFTVNSNIHIELEREDIRLFWWDFIIHSEPVFPDEYRLGRIIKVPDLLEGDN